jgi:hypothetical protein
MERNAVAANPGTRAAFVDENGGHTTYNNVVAWVQDEIETGVFHPVVIDRDFPAEASVLEDSICFVRICFDGENLNGGEIDQHAKKVRDELRRDAEFDERSPAIRKQIGTALLAAYPAALSKAELLARGVADIDGMLLPLLGLLKNNRLINEGHAGMFALTEKGLKQAKASAEKAT